MAHAAQLGGLEGALRLLDRGLGAAGVTLSPAPVKGVLRLPPSLLRCTFPVLRNPAGKNKTFSMSPKQFHYAFTNTMNDQDAKAAYDRYAAPAPNRVAFQAAFANVNPRALTITVPAEVGDVRVRIVKPAGATGTLPAVLYMHGGGWVLGNSGTHDRLVRELAVGAGVAVVFVEYDRSPEAHYPVAIEQGYATAQWITKEGSAEGLDATRLAVAGDSVGGNMTAALTLLASQRGDVTFVHQSMYYPVTDAAQDTESYREFADGPFLTAKGMAWFWDCYLPDESRRSEITASPLRAGIDQLAGLPEAFLIVDENDVLRDEGEAYGRKLTEAGVRTTCIRYNGIIHDFMMLNPLRATAATTGAVEQAIHVLRKALGTG